MHRPCEGPVVLGPNPTPENVHLREKGLWAVPRMERFSPAIVASARGESPQSPVRTRGGQGQVIEKPGASVGELERLLRRVWVRVRGRLVREIKRENRLPAGLLSWATAPSAKQP